MTNPPELYQWDYHFDYLNRIELSEEEKLRVSKGLSVLKDLFGPDWLPSMRGKLHTLLRYLENKAPWSQLWIADFAEKLQSISSMVGFGDLLKRLINPTEYDGAYSELVLAAKFLRAGLRFTMYPEVSKDKILDFKFSLSSDDIFIEVKTLFTPKAIRNYNRTMAQLGPWEFSSSKAHDNNIKITGRIYKTLSQPRLKEISSLIHRAIDEVISGSSLKEVKIARVIEYYVFKGETPPTVPEEFRKEEI